MSTTTTVETSIRVTPSPYLPKVSNDRIHTLDELIKRRVSELGDSPLIGYPKEGIADFEEHSARAVDRYVDACAVRLQELGLALIDPSIDNPPVVGILARSGLHVIITILALSRLGYTVFLLSTRLSSPAILQLCNLANCSTILTTENFHATLAEVQKSRPLDLKTLPAHSDYYGKDAPAIIRCYDPQRESKKVAAIIHSSGSTGMPKPIVLPHRSLIAAFATNMDMRAFIASPMFHSHGFYETFRSIHSGKPIYYCNYAYPLTQQSLMDMLNTVKPEIFHCVPYMVKLLAESEKGIECLTRVDMVLFGGSACPDDLGDKLVKRGVNLVANYGATETGRLMNSARPSGDMDWNYLRLLPVAKPWVLMDEIAPHIHECVALRGLKSKSTINSDEPPGSFRTRDLFSPHPTRPGLWKYVSRLDDRFTLINGEKVLPLAMEGRIRQERIVKEACVFGERRSFPGLLAIKADRAADMPDDEFLDRLWPAIEDANAQTEAFARVPRDLVVVVPASTEYPRTDKGTFIRLPLYQQFQAEIDAAYEAYEGSEYQGSLCLTGRDLEDFLLTVVNQKSGVDILSSDTDFFAAGIDSLQCVQIWNVIKRELDLGGRQSELSQNVVYETGSIRKLALHLECLRTGAEADAQDDFAKMEELIEKYSRFQSRRSEPQRREIKEEVVLLTGATGGLGAHILGQLVVKPNVAAVWALVRAPSKHAATERVRASLGARHIQLDPGLARKIVALPCDLSRPDLGLEPERLKQLHNGVTCVIHNAWAVNFNIPMQSFEDQHIKATHNLIQLCLDVSAAPQPARFFYCSSVSAAGASPRPGTVPETPVPSPTYAQSTGYARSKYVAEYITHSAAKNTAVPARVLRIGQLVGDTKVGEWNAAEGIPMMIHTAETLGALPALNEEMTWLPVDCAASVILELTNLSGTDDNDRDTPERGPDLVYHVLNPTAFNWSKDMIPALAKAGLEFELLPTDQWMERLRYSDRDPVANPPIKLLGWFESKYGSAGSSTKPERLRYLTDQTVEDSPTLRALPDVTDIHFVERMVGRLRKGWNQERVA